MGGQPNIDSTDSNVQPSDRASLPSANSPLAQEAFRQLESNLSEQQREVISEFKNKIQSGNVGGEEVGELFKDLKSAPNTNQFARRLDEFGKELDLPVDSRQQIQNAYGQLTREDRLLMQQALQGIDFESLAKWEQDQPDSGRSGTSSGSSLETASGGSSASRPSQSQLQDLGREFLQDALETYSDPESGYELSDAFKRLKDQAEGVRSDRELANFGDLSKQLFEDSSKIFDGANSSSEDRKKRGLKPGQRLDQLLTSAAQKAFAKKKNDAADQDDSVFGGVLNQALGAALDQAVSAADGDLENRNRDVAQGWDQSAAGNLNQNGLLDGFAQPPNNYTENGNGSGPFDSDTNFPTDNSTDNKNSAAENSLQDSIQDSAANFTDAISDLDISWQQVVYVVGFIVLLAGSIYLLSGLLQPVSKAELQQRELQLKLKNRSASPKDLVEAVDLFLLSRFGAASSWWNANHAADQISKVQPEGQDKVASLFQVYRWSRYQPDGDTRVSPEQNEQVKSTLRELSQVPVASFVKAKSSGASDARSTVHDAEGQS